MKRSKKIFSIPKMNNVCLPFVRFSWIGGKNVFYAFHYFTFHAHQGTLQLSLMVYCDILKKYFSFSFLLFYILNKKEKNGAINFADLPSQAEFSDAFYCYFIN